VGRHLENQCITRGENATNSFLSRLFSANILFVVISTTINADYTDNSVFLVACCLAMAHSVIILDV